MIITIMILIETNFRFLYQIDLKGGGFVEVIYFAFTLVNRDVQSPSYVIAIVF